MEDCYKVDKQDESIGKTCFLSTSVAHLTKTIKLDLCIFGTLAVAGYSSNARSRPCFSTLQCRIHQSLALLENNVEIQLQIYLHPQRTFAYGLMASTPAHFRPAPLFRKIMDLFLRKTPTLRYPRMETSSHQSSFGNRFKVQTKLSHSQP